MAASVDQKLLRQTKFPPEFSQKVDMQKVNVEVMKKWIAGKITEILGSEDDIVIELCFGHIEGSRFPDIKSLQIQLTGFLDKDAAKFCKELWSLCLSAQSNPQGVPKELLEAKKLELLQEKVDAGKAVHVGQQKKEQEHSRDSETDAIRQRGGTDRGERFERGRGRGGVRGGRGGRGDFESRRFRDSHSPPRRRSLPFRGPPSRRDVDTYIPSGRGGRRANGRGRSRTRSSSRSPSRSPSRRRRRASSSRSLSERSESPPRRRRDEPMTNKKASTGESRTLSPNLSDISHSRSPRRKRRREHRSRSSSRNRGPPRHRYRRGSPHSRSRTRSRSHSLRRRRGDAQRYSHRRRTSSTSSRDRRDKRTDIIRSRPVRNDPRLSRSPDDLSDRRRRRSSDSRSHSGSPKRSQKRRRSLHRWEPGPKRRNTSSPSSSPEPKKRRMSDSGDDGDMHKANDKNDADEMVSE